MDKRSILFIDDNGIVDTSSYNIFVKDYQIPSATAKTNYVSVEGRSGDLDLSEAHGRQYNDTTTEIELVWIDFQSVLFDELKAKIHNRRMLVVLPHDLTHYYDARITVGTVDTGSFPTVNKITMVARPYKYKLEVTTVEVTSSGVYTLTNESMPTVPVFKCESETTIKFGDNTYTLSAGDRQVASIILEYGNNEVTISSTGKVTIEYQEGAL